MQFEKDQGRTINISKAQLVNSLVNQDETMIPADLGEHNDESYLNCLESPHLGLAFENLTEYLLEYTASQPRSMENIPEEEYNRIMQSRKDAAFWFKLSLKYFERVCPDKLDKQLVLLGLFYSTMNKTKQAEGIFKQAIVKMKRKNQIDYKLMMAYNLLGRMLMRTPGREMDGVEYVKESEGLREAIPYWWDTLEVLYLRDFFLS